MRNGRSGKRNGRVLLAARGRVRECEDCPASKVSFHHRPATTICTPCVEFTLLLKDFPSNDFDSSNSGPARLL